MKTYFKKKKKVRYSSRQTNLLKTALVEHSSYLDINVSHHFSYALNGSACDKKRLCVLPHHLHNTVLNMATALSSSHYTCHYAETVLMENKPFPVKIRYKVTRWALNTASWTCHGAWISCIISNILIIVYLFTGTRVVNVVLPINTKSLCQRKHNSNAGKLSREIC